MPCSLFWSRCLGTILGMFKCTRTVGVLLAALGQTSEVMGCPWILLDLSPMANTRLESPVPLGMSAPLVPADGGFELSTIPFRHLAGEYAWSSHIAATNGSETKLTVTLDEPLVVNELTRLYTQMNTYWGSSREPAGRLRFIYENGEIRDVDIVGNVHVRDYHQWLHTNELDEGVAAMGLGWACDGVAATRRLDTQQWPIPTVGSAKLVGIEIEDLGASGVSRLVVGGMTISPELKCGFNCCTPSWPDRCRECIFSDGQALGQLLVNWSEVPSNECTHPSPYDFTEDGRVNAADLGKLLSAWGEPCPE